MRRVAGLAHPRAERGNAVCIEPGEVRRVAVLEQAVGLGDAGARAVLAGIDHRAARRAGASRDRVVAQHHGVAAQLHQPGEEFDERVVGRDVLEAQDLLQRLDEAALGSIGEAREAILVAGNEQDVGPRGQLVGGVRDFLLDVVFGRFLGAARHLLSP